MATDFDTSQQSWRSRRSAWLRDELILALDLYRRKGRNPPSTDLAEVSQLLRDIPIESELATDPRFRTPAAVGLKVVNFVAIDPDATTIGMSRGGRADAAVFEEFWGTPERLAAAAAAIRANLGALSAPDSGAVIFEDGTDAPEGRLLTRIHRARERNAALAKRRKDQEVSRAGALVCDCCSFDFAATYGKRGEGFIECHHVLPVSQLRPGSRTRLQDLALVCANCHRMIHRTVPWLTIAQMRTLISSER